MTSLADSLTLDALERDPDPILARLREEAPVAYSSSMDLWLVTRWDDVEHMERHPEIFSASTEPSFLRRALGQNMLTQDAPEAERLKRAMMPPFQRSGKAGGFAEEILPALCDALIDEHLAEGAMDVVSPYAAAVSAGSLKTVLGLDDNDWREVWDWCEGLCGDIANFENEPDKAARGQETKAALERALDRRIEELRETTSDTALAHMLAVDAGGRP